MVSTCFLNEVHCYEKLKTKYFSVAEESKRVMSLSVYCPFRVESLLCFHFLCLAWNAIERYS